MLLLTALVIRLYMALSFCFSLFSRRKTVNPLPDLAKKDKKKTPVIKLHPPHTPGFHPTTTRKQIEKVIP